ncbi:MAG: universal stress protein [Chitinophagaceae bacterium]
MKKIIVPVDFSDTSKNAALYAVQIADQLKATVTLINVVDPIVAGSDGTPLADATEGVKKITEMALENIRLSMSDSNPSVAISHIANESNSLSDSLEKIVSEQNADLIIMGITGSSLIERIAIGSNTINIVQKNICPVIIVPPYAQYKEIKRILFATDFKNADETTPLNYIKEFMDVFQPELYVVNVDSENTTELSEEYKLQRAKMETLLSGYMISFHFIKQDDFNEAISQFSADNNIDLILIEPKKHSFFSNLFSSGRTRKLAYHSHVPILAIHE